jgi:hypothetical protein
VGDCVPEALTEGDGVTVGDAEAEPLRRALPVKEGEEVGDRVGERVDDSQWVAEALGVSLAVRAPDAERLGLGVALVDAREAEADTVEEAVAHCESESEPHAVPLALRVAPLALAPPERELLGVAHADADREGEE